MRHVFFMHRDLAGALTEMVGSDGYFRPDQRWGHERVKAEARAHAARLRNVRPDIEAFVIAVGPRISEARVVAGPFALA
jgi:hypothetical protein